MMPHIVFTSYMHAWYVSYCRECNNLESFAAGSLYSTPALQLMSRVYQCCCGQRAEKPAAVMGPQLRARQLWSMRGLWNIHGTMRYATSRLFQLYFFLFVSCPVHAQSVEMLVHPKKRQRGSRVRCVWKAIVFIYHKCGSYGSIGRSGSSVIFQARATDTRCWLVVSWPKRKCLSNAAHTFSSFFLPRCS